MSAENRGEPGPNPAEADGEVPLDARRLTDKLKIAMSQAMDQGRDAIAERLRLCYEAALEEEAEYDGDRRGDDE